jgi:hypothetical protein
MQTTLTRNGLRTNAKHPSTTILNACLSDAIDLALLTKHARTD